MNRLETTLTALEQQNRRRRFVAMLADALVFRLSIPAGRQLVMVLGDGSACDNRDAVRQWVEAELPTLDEVDATQLQGELALRLYRRLQSREFGGMSF